MKVVGFTLPLESEEHLQRLQKQLGWSRSQIVRELLARAQVVGHLSVTVELPSATEIGESVGARE